MKDDYMNRLVEYARENYVRLFNLAVKNDFSTKSKLYSFDKTVSKWYTKYKRKPKKLVKFITFCSGQLYNNEMVIDEKCFSAIAILITITKRRLYNSKNFAKTYKENTIEWIREGLRYRYIMDAKIKLLGDIEC